MIDGTLTTIDDRPALRFERRLTHPVERVWRAVSEPAELELWFPAAVDWTPAAGETLEAGGMSGEVLAVDAPHRLVWTFADERYSFELTPEDDGCILVFTHVFDDRSRAAQTATGWWTYLWRLGPHLTGVQVSEGTAHEPWEEIHEAYAERFELDPTPGRQFAAALRAGS